MRNPRRAALGVLAILLAAAPVRAQSLPDPGRAERPYRGIFGSGRGDTEQNLFFTGNLGGGVERVSFFGGPDAEQTRRPAESDGSYNWLGSVAYSLNRDRVGMNAAMTSATRYYSATSGNGLTTHTARVGGFAQPFQTTRVSLSASAGRQPLTVLSLLPEIFIGDTDPSLFGGYDLDTTIDSFVTSDVNLEISQSIARHTGLSAGGRYYWSDFPGSNRDQRIQMLFGGISHQLNQSLDLRVGYQQSIGTYVEPFDGTNQRVRSHSLDAGINFNHTLSFSRRTTLRVNTGSTMISDDAVRRFRITGTAGLIHEMGRTWSSSLTYERQVGFLRTLRAPAFSDAVTFSVDGLLGRRLQVHSSAGASIGAVGLRDKGNGYRAYQGEASATIGLARSLGLTFGYNIYRYRFDTVENLPSPIVASGFRQSLRVNLAVYVPLFNRVRLTNATR